MCIFKTLTLMNLSNLAHLGKEAFMGTNWETFYFQPGAMIYDNMTFYDGVKYKTSLLRYDGEVLIKYTTIEE